MLFILINTKKKKLGKRGGKGIGEEREIIINFSCLYFLSSRKEK